MRLKIRYKQILIKLILISSGFNFAYSQSSILSIEDKINCNDPATTIKDLPNGVNYFKARDEVKIEKNIKACSTRTAVIKTDPDIIPVLNRTSTSAGQAVPGLVTSDGNYINEPTSISQTNIVGYIPGSAMIAPNGSSSYTIPIDLPTAPGGIKPDLSIVYSNLLGSGTLGWGWELNGLSSIARVPQNKYFDNAIRPVSLDAGDGISLDGLRLLNTSGQPAIADNLITEAYSYTSIIRSFTDNTNAVNKLADKFTVTDKMGNVSVYGTDNNSSLIPDGSGIPLAWKINSLKDPNGNEIKYIYSTSGGENHLQRIDYGINGGSQPLYSILFKYSSRIDQSIVYLNNYKVYKNLVLKSIDVLVSNSLIRTYTFDYAYVNGFSRLVKVSQKVGNSDITPTIVNWTATPDVLTENKSHGLPNMANAKNLQSADFNGDGYNDLFFEQNNGFQIWKGSASGSFSLLHSRSRKDFDASKFGFPTKGPVGLLLTINYQAYYKFWAIDVDNDGKSELVTMQNPSKYELRRKTTSGKGGIVYVLAGTSTRVGNTLYKAISFTDGGGAVSIDSSLIFNFNDNKLNSWNQVMQGDFDGDGNTEIVLWQSTENGDGSDGCQNFYDNGTPCPNSQSTPDYMVPVAIYPASRTLNMFANFPHSSMNIPLDYNSDGKTDFLELFIFDFVPRKNHLESTNMNISTGTTFSQSFPNYYGLKENKAIYPKIGDFNGDGKPDILVYHPTKLPVDCDDCCYGYGPQIHLNTGNLSTLYELNDNFTSSSLAYLNNQVTAVRDQREIYDNAWPEQRNEVAKERVFIADFNGDGKSDIFYIKNNNSNIFTLCVGYSNGSSFEWVTRDEQIDLETDGKLDFTESIELNDFNHDGNIDVMIVDSSKKVHFYYLNKSEIEPVNAVKNVTNGFNQSTSFAYGRSLKGASYFTEETAAFNKNNLVKYAPLWLATGMTFPDGIGGTQTQSYAYEGGLAHKFGKGLLGFDKFTSSNTVQKTKTVMNFTIDKTYFIPYANSVINYTTESGSDVMTGRIIYTNKFTAYGSGKAFVNYVKNSSSENSLLNTTVTQDRGFNTSTGNIDNSTSTYYSDGWVVDGTEKVVYTYAQVGASGNITKPKTETLTKKIGNENAFTISTSYDTYDNNGRLTALTSQNVVRNYAYDKYGNVTSETSTPVSGTKMSKVNTMSADGRFLLSSSVNNQFTTSYDYDGIKGYMVKQTGVDGLVTYYNGYDDLGRILETIDPLGNITINKYEWAASGNELYKITSNSTHSPETIAYFDILGRAIRTTQADVIGVTDKIIEARQVYNATRQVTSIYTPHYQGEIEGTLISYTYATDGSKRLATTTDSKARSVSYTYDKLKTSFTDANNRIISSETNSMDLVLTATDVANKSVLTSYHSSGQPSMQTVNGTNLSMTYDSFGRIRTSQDPSLGSLTNSYYDDDNIKTQTDNRGTLTSYTYDNLARVSNKIQSNTTQTSNNRTINYTYISDGPAKGHIEKAFFSGNTPQTLTYSYDGLGRPQNLTQEIASGSLAKKIFISQNTYYPTGEVKTKTFPSGEVVSYDYDKLGGLIQINRNGVPIWTLKNKRADEVITSYGYGNGTNVDITYDEPTGFPLTYIATLSSSLKYSYGTTFNIKTGNLTNRTNFYKNGDTPLTETFTYDPSHDRVTNIAQSNNTVNQVISYDDKGNIITKYDAGTYTYDATNVYAMAGLATTTGSAASAITQTVSYDADNMPTQVKDVNEADISYGPDGNRTYMKDVNHTIYYGDDYEQEIDASGNIIREWTYIFAPSGLAAVIINSPQDNLGGLYYVHSDHLGSPMLMVKVDGTVAEQYSFDTWGRRRDPQTWAPLTDVQAIATRLLRRGFTGHEHLDKYGLINMNGRMYDPVLGRMQSPDPFIQGGLPQGYNRYSYVLNNPLKYTDPSGYNTEAMQCGGLDLPIWFMDPAFALTVTVLNATGINAFTDFYSWAKYNGKTIEHVWLSGVVIAGTVVVSVVTLGTGAPASAAFAVSVCAGAALGFVGGAGGAIIDHRPADEVWAQGAIGFGVGALTAMVGGEVGGSAVEAFGEFGGAVATGAVAGGVGGFVGGGLNYQHGGGLQWNWEGAASGLAMGASFGAIGGAIGYGVGKGIGNFRQGRNILTGKEGNSAGARSRQIAFMQENATACTTCDNVLDEFVITAKKADAWAYGTGGQAFAQFIASFNPFVSLMNAYSGATSGQDIYGNQMSGGDVIMSAAGGMPGGGMIRFGKIAVNANKFHRVIKPSILKSAGKFQKVVGNNPDIMLDGGKVFLKGTGPFRGKTFETGLDAINFFE
jgi:RHS repeat-associated protein